MRGEFVAPGLGAGMSRIRVLLVSLALAASSAGAAAQAQPPVPPERPQNLQQPSAPEPPIRPEKPADPKPPETPRPEPAHARDPSCRAGLQQSGAILDEKRAIAPPQDQACAIVEPVVLMGVRRADGSDIQFPDRPVLACAMAQAVARFAVAELDALARGAFSSSIKSVGTGPGHDCRPRNRQAGAKMSSHAQGLAVDIMHIAFDKAPPLVVEKRDAPGQEGFVARLLEKACAAFNTVLGPQSDTFHTTNIHIDIEPRGRDGRTKYCR